MDRIHLTLVGALLAFVAMLCPGPLNAQARGPSSDASEQPAKDPAQIAAEHNAKLAALDVWLRRLTGQFRYEGIRDPGTQSAQGSGNCIGIGRGPGVHCVINLSWPSTRGDPGLATMEPAMMLYGIDTNAEAIRTLQVNSKGIPEGALGFLNGNVATFKLGCVNQPARPPCRRFIRIEATPDGKFVYLWDDTEYFISLPRGGEDWVRLTGLVLSLRREQATEASPIAEIGDK